MHHVNSFQKLIFAFITGLFREDYSLFISIHANTPILSTLLCAWFQRHIWSGNVLFPVCVCRCIKWKSNLMGPTYSYIRNGGLQRTSIALTDLSLHDIMNGKRPLMDQWFRASVTGNVLLIIQRSRVWILFGLNLRVERVLSHTVLLNPFLVCVMKCNMFKPT